MPRPFLTPLVLTLVVTLMAATTAVPAKRSPGCGADSRYGERLRQTTLALPSDSSSLESYGLAIKPTTATVLTNNAVCDSVSAAHNATVAGDSSWMVLTSAPLIVKAGTSYFMALPPRTGYVGWTVFVYDSVYASKDSFIW